MPETDYQSLIDQATWAFIARTNACYPADTANGSIAEQRRIYDAMARSFHHGYPKGITAQDQSIAGVPCRIYPGKMPSVIYLHGGGYMMGGLRSHDDVCAEICAQTGFQVVSVDYRLAPEHPHPAAYDDALAVTRALAAMGPCLLAGDSAGATIAASVTHTVRRTPAAPMGLLLIYPGLGGNPDQGSFLTHAHAPMLTRADTVFYGAIRHKDGVVPQHDPTARVLQDTDFSDLPPTEVFSAECDPYCDDGRDYCARIAAAGGRANWHLERGLVHGYLRARHSVPRAKDSFAKIIAAIATLGTLP